MEFWSVGVRSLSSFKNKFGLIFYNSLAMLRSPSRRLASFELSVLEIFVKSFWGKVSRIAVLVYLFKFRSASSNVEAISLSSSEISSLGISLPPEDSIE